MPYVIGGQTVALEHEPRDLGGPIYVPLKAVMRALYRKACATRFRRAEAANSAAPPALVPRAVCSPRVPVPSRLGKKRGTRERVPRQATDVRVG